MRRKTNKAQILSIIEKLRAEIPSVVIRTSLMVGFPSETQDQFQEMVDFVKKAQLNHIGVFKYSREKESHSDTLDGHLPEEVKQERYELLMNEQLKVVRKNQRKLIGNTFKVIVEGYHPDSQLLMKGRFYGQCPDIDGQIILNEHDKVTAFSELYDVEITDFADYDLIGRVVKRSKDPCKKLAFV